MRNDKDLEESVHNLIVDICEVLYKQGYSEVPIGAVMRLVGVDPEKAAKHDQEYFMLDEEFKAALEMRKFPGQTPPGITFH